MSSNPSHYYQRQMETKVAEAQSALQHAANAHPTAIHVEHDRSGGAIALLCAAAAAFPLGMLAGALFMGWLS